MAQQIPELTILISSIQLSFRYIHIHNQRFFHLYYNLHIFSNFEYSFIYIQGFTSLGSVLLLLSKKFGPPQSRYLSPVLWNGTAEFDDS